MATAGTTVRGTGSSGVLGVVAYLGLTALLLFLYFRAVIELLPVRDRIMMGYEAVMAPRLSTLELLGIGVLVLLVLAFYRQILALLNYIPAGVRGLILPAPVYLVVTRDVVTSGVLVGLAAVIWLLYRPLGAALSGALRSVPAPVLEPLARFWAAVLYTALVTKAVLPVLLALAVMLGYHYLDKSVERAFAPVWAWHRALPSKQWFGLFAGRLVLGGTAPFILTQYLAWSGTRLGSAFGASMFADGRAAPMFGLIAGLVGYFLMRMPKGAGSSEPVG